MLILFPSKHFSTRSPHYIPNAGLLLEFCNGHDCQVHVYRFFFIEEEALVSFGFLIFGLFVPKSQQLNHILKGTLSEIFSALDELCVRMN